MEGEISPKESVREGEGRGRETKRLLLTIDSILFATISLTHIASPPSLSP